MRIKDFIYIFLNHYGEEILSNLANYNSDSFDIKTEKLHFEENKSKINEFLIKYRRSKSSGCNNPKCIEIFGKEFLNRPQEFSAWRGDLDFRRNTPAKSVMMIGEAAGPAISTCINVPYGLSNLHINDKGVMENEKTIEMFEDFKKTRNRTLFG